MNRLEAQKMRGKPTVTPTEKLRRQQADEARPEDKARVFRDKADTEYAKRFAELSGRQ